VLAASRPDGDGEEDDETKDRTEAWSMTTLDELLAALTDAKAERLP
jgi:hypothetical protein